MKKTNIGITEENRKKVAERLNKVLSDEFILYSKTLNAHWNVEGPDFHTVHVYLEQLYNEQQEIVDTVAEKIRSIGHYALGDLSQYVKNSHLSEKLTGKFDSQNLFKELLEDHESIIIYLRENISKFAEDFNAEGMSDYITALMENHEKTAWMLRSHLN